MNTKAIIRDNITLNVNPEGLETEINRAINEIKDFEMISDKPINVLVIGGSSGYGLASMLALKEKANANIVSISFEREAKGKRMGSFGYYNNQIFMEKYPETKMINGDAFSFEVKDEVIDYYKTNDQKIDLIIYSLASGVRVDPFTNEKYISSLKPIGKDYTGLNIDMGKDILKTQTLTSASEEEIAATVKVMGGEDYLLWAKHLRENNVLNKDIKFVTYTYLGPELTHDIYKNGTIGYAKRDLEETNKKINELIKDLNGKAYISQSKAVVTKASIFIPTMALYASALFKVMKEKGTHESVIAHKYRLFKDFVFNKYDEDAISLDAFEMEEDTQNKVNTILNELNEDNFKDLIDYDAFKKEYLKLNGF